MDVIYSELGYVGAWTHVVALHDFGFSGRIFGDYAGGVTIRFTDS